MWTRRLVLALAFLVLLACGGEEGARHPRVRVGTFQVDGPLPEGLVLLSTRDREPQPFPLVRVEGASDLYDVPGAPEGPFRIGHPDGWGSIATRTVHPALQKGAPPPYVHVGRPHTLYVDSAHPSLRPGRTWVVTVRGPEGRRVVRPKVEIESGGTFAALRLAPSEGVREALLFGRLSLGSVERRPADEPEEGPYAEPRAVTMPSDGRPVLVRVRPAAASRIHVYLLGTKADLDAELSFEGLPIPYRAEGRGRDGLLRFDGIPAFDLPLRMHLGKDRLLYRIPESEHRDLEAVWLRFVDPEGGRRVRLVAKDETPVDRVFAAEGDAYGRLPEPEDGAWLLPASEVNLLIEGDGRWASLALESGVGEVLDLSLRHPVRVQGSVADVSPSVPCAIRFFRHEGEARLAGQGLQWRVLAQGGFECHLPAGLYDLEVATPRGKRRRPVPLDLTKPGAHLHTTLEAP